MFSKVHWAGRAEVHQGSLARAEVRGGSLKFAHVRKGFKLRVAKVLQGSGSPKVL